MKDGRTAIVVTSLLLTFTALSSIPFLFDGYGFAMLLAFTPLFCLEEVCRRRGVRHSGLLYISAFILFNSATTFWIWNISPIGAVGAIAVNVIFMTVIFRFFTFCRSLCAKSGKAQSILPYLLFIFLWISWEHLYCEIELSWPWLILGNAFAASPELIQWYEYTGVEGGSLWALSASVAAFVSIRELSEGNRLKARTAALAAVAAVLVPSIVSLCRYHGYREKGPAVEMAAVQPNIDPLMKYGVISQSVYDGRMIELLDSVITPRTKYAITPETFTYDIDLRNPEGSFSYRRYSGFLAGNEGLSMILGALTIYRYDDVTRPTPTARKMNGGWFDVFNSAMMLPVGGDVQCSHKSKLVPGVEIIPYKDAIPFLAEICKQFGGSSESYGRNSRIVALEGLDGHIAAPMVCYESVYGDYVTGAVRDGADFLAVITNDGWWGDTPGYRQHFRFARLRAIENRRDLIQVANNGTSGIINQRGDVVKSTAYWVETAFVGDVHTNTAMTFFSLHGDVIGRYSVIPALFMMLMIISYRVSDRKSARGRSAAGRP